MASFERKPNGRIKAIIRMQVRDGGPKSKTFSSMPRARLWAAQREAELSDISEGQIPKHTLGEAFDRYAKEVSPSKRGGRWEKIRLSALPSTGGGILRTNLLLNDIPPALLAKWRDARLTEVSAGTLLRELSLLSAVFQRCVREWQWLRENPVKLISKPAAPAHRDKVLSRVEIYKILRALQQTGTESTTYRIGLAFLFALRTGMRAGEICGITGVNCHADRVVLPQTKNGTARAVPLSRKAAKVLRRVQDSRADAIDKGETVFGLTSASLDALFRKARARAGLSGFTFHDSRHHFCTYAARKLSPFELARMMGHKDLKMTMRYYNESAGNIAAKLDKRI